MDQISLSTAQEFEIERLNRIVDSVDNISDLKKLCKQLIHAWMIQRAAATWAIKQIALERGN